MSAGVVVRGVAAARWGRKVVRVVRRGEGEEGSAGGDLGEEEGGGGLAERGKRGVGLPLRDLQGYLGMDGGGRGV